MVDDASLIHPTAFYAHRVVIMRLTHLFFICLMSVFSTFSQAANLLEIYRDAVQNDYVMKMAGAQLRIDQESYDQAMAKYLPQVNLDSGYQKGRNKFKQSDTPKLPDGAVDSLKQLLPSVEPHYNRDTDGSQWKLALTQEVFNMPYWYGMRSTEHLTKAAEYTFFSAQQDLIVRTTEAYLGVLRAQNNLASSKAEERAYKQQLEQTTQRFKVGLVANTDVQEAQAAYDLAVVKRLGDQGQLEVSFEALTVLTGKRYQAIDKLSQKFIAESPVPLDREGWVTQAMKTNPDLNKKRETYEASELSAKSIATTRLPTVSFGANYGRGHSDVLNNVNNEDSSLAVTMRMPVFTSGSVSSKIRQEYAKLNLAKDDLGSTERQVNQQIRSAHIETLTSIQTVKARKQSIVSSQSSLNATLAGYEYGTRNILDVLNAQKALYAAQKDYGNSRYDYILSMMKLKQVGGVLTPDDIIALNNWFIPAK